MRRHGYNLFAIGPPGVGKQTLLHQFLGQHAAREKIPPTGATCSASLAELCALLSSLADVPIRQSLAITGSVNQQGQVQSIGAVNEKIEGFFDICKERGLSGERGALIPKSNVKNLMLRKDVIDAVEASRFQIYAIESADDAIELLTGKPNGLGNERPDTPATKGGTKLAKKAPPKKYVATSYQGIEPP